MIKQDYALALCRVSSREQLENNSLNRQRQSVERMAQELGVIIPEDGWWSGSVSSKKGKNLNRADLIAIINRCKKDKRIKFLIVDEVDRFMRSITEMFYFLVEFERLGVVIKFASQPNLNTNNALNTLQLVLEAYKSEGSNEERQRKSISGQVQAINEGRYPFAPKPGYRKGRIDGVQELHPIRGVILREMLLAIASKRLTPTEALIKLNASAFTDGHSKYKMDKFRKIVTDPFNAGILEIDKQVKARNEHGLHEPLITKGQYEKILDVMRLKPKTQIGPSKNGNPEFPLSNIITCMLCEDKQNGRFVGYNHGNGKNKELVYQKYRCRACGRYLSKREMHDAFVANISQYQISETELKELTNALKYVWSKEESDRKLEIQNLGQQIVKIQNTIEIQVAAAINPENATIKHDILLLTEKKKIELSELKQKLENLNSSSVDDFNDFISSSLRTVNNMATDFLDLDKNDRLKCKQILFPGGFYLDKNNKVYTPEVSPIYRLVSTKKDAEASMSSHLVRVAGVSLHPSANCAGNCNRSLLVERLWVRPLSLAMALASRTPDKKKASPSGD